MNLIEINAWFWVLIVFATILGFAGFLFLATLTEFGWPALFIIPVLVSFFVFLETGP